MLQKGSDITILPHGKFLSRDSQKFFFKAIRFDEVKPDLNFSEKLELRKRMEDLKDGHTTGLVVADELGDACLDIAAQAGLAVLLEITIEPREILDKKIFPTLVSRVAHIANIRGGHRALLGYLLDCRLAGDQIRRHGLDLIQKRMRKLVRAIRERDERSLVALKHRPDTRGLALHEEDFLFGAIPALEPARMREFVVSLHNLAESRPVMIEFCEASPGQDEAVAYAFAHGAAGVVAPPIRPAPRHDFLNFRVLRATELLPFVTLNGSCPPQPVNPPMVSVVICAYNAERTMRACLESLRKLVYPNFEVVIVDDGSRDATAQISMEFPEFRLIRQPNKGLSVARNVGMQAARGSIIAYTDSDCVVDPHWLTLIVNAMVEHGWEGCGGPNYGPHEEGRVEGCVAASPGAPAPVLIGENLAEHLTGCNMVFTKSSLLKIGGFDARFTAAGDDVDICWRLLDAGMTLGYCPGAFVWHFRRNTVKAYYGQQRGYGRSEALLYVKYPERFNALGQIKWRGRIPGHARLLPGGSRRRIWWNPPHHGHQTVYEPVHGFIKYLPATLEWSGFWGLMTVAAFVGGWSVIPSLVMFAAGPIWALHYAMNAKVEKCHDGLLARLFVAWLAYTGPMTRTITRLKLRMGLGGRPALPDAILRQRPALSLRKRAIHLSYWNEAYTTRDALLDRVLKFLANAHLPAAIDQGWNDYDVEVRPDSFVRVELKTADEEHEGTKLKNHVVARIRMSKFAKRSLVVGASASALCAGAAAPTLAAAFAAATLIGGAYVAAQMAGAGRLAYRAIEQSAAELALMPLGKPVAAVRGKNVLEPAAAASRAVNDQTPVA